MNTKDNENDTLSYLCVMLTWVRVERCGRPTGGLSASGTKAEEFLDVGGEQLSPWTTGVIQKDGVNDEGQQPLTAVHAHLQTNRGEKLRAVPVVVGQSDIALNRKNMWWLAVSKTIQSLFLRPGSKKDPRDVAIPLGYFQSLPSQSWNYVPQMLHSAFTL